MARWHENCPPAALDILLVESIKLRRFEGSAVHQRKISALFAVVEIFVAVTRRLPLSVLLESFFMLLVAAGGIPYDFSLAVLCCMRALCVGGCCRAFTAMALLQDFRGNEVS